MILQHLLQFAHTFTIWLLWFQNMKQTAFATSRLEVIIEAPKVLLEKRSSPLTCPIVLFSGRTRRVHKCTASPVVRFVIAAAVRIGLALFLDNLRMNICIYILEWIDTDRSESLCRMGRCLDLVYPQHADTCSWNQPKFKIFVHIKCETVWDEKDKPGATKANSFCKVLTLPISISTHVLSERAPSMKFLTSICTTLSSFGSEFLFSIQWR